MLRRNLRNCRGYYGNWGGNIPLVLECLEASAYGIITKGNGDVILTEEKHTSLSTGGASRTRLSSGISEEAVGFDGYNAILTGNISSTIGVNCGMSTGRNGVIQPIVLESTQDHATISRTGICVTLTASMGTGGA